jgi:hypothetical protein
MFSKFPDVTTVEYMGTSEGNISQRKQITKDLKQYEINEFSQIKSSNRTLSRVIV